ncbi:hypothetical protein BDV29DRAFT_163745 [Aspergillus leporis]|uniref:Arrestin-like N-terminal domain-containing protein n=1 Tax=Aspergillus leporis TaxID=41062 RepID=A0A5N5WJ01_9EURO|nr:hypothetical protein BDV29DRAFT_163745 [Aspergillus leporis]
MTKIVSLLRSCSSNTGSSPSKESVSINIAGPGDNRPYVFTTSDRIDGVVTITMTEKSAFDDIKLTFEGISKVLTWGGINRPPLTGGRHTFMKVHHPIKNEYRPASIPEPGWCYKLPFTFVVPDRLPLMASDHKADHAGIKQAYTRLPPSMCTETATERCFIQYIIRVTIPRKLCGNDQRTGNLLNAVQPVKIFSISYIKKPQWRYR